MLIAKKIIPPSVYVDCSLSNIVRLEFANDYDFNQINVYFCCIDGLVDHEHPIATINTDNIKNIDFYDYLINVVNNADVKKIHPLCKPHLKTDISHKFTYICGYDKTRPFSISAALQRTCNLQCIMCRDRYIINKNQDGIYFDILNRLRNHNIMSLELTTVGEPFFYKEKILNYLNSLTTNDFKNIYITSNLTLLDTNDIEIIAKIQAKKNIRFCFTVSIDGITDDTYKNIRKNNFFNRVMNNALLLKKHNMLSLVNFVVQPDNMHELLPAYEYWKITNNVEFNAIPVNSNSINITNDPEYLRFLKIKNGNC